MSTSKQKSPKYLRKTPVQYRRFCFVVSGGYPFFIPFLAVSHP